MTTIKNPYTLGRKHNLDKRKHEDREKRLYINIKAGRTIYTSQIAKVYAMLPFTSEENSTFNACVSELNKLGYKFVEKDSCFKK